ncbi:MAG: hypothetical protein IJ057_06395 [Bacteroidales bacterium]|nr:hypothetical protein [Bacteroidales bacterium]
MMKDNDGKLVAMPWGFDPLRRYIAELDNILLTGEIGDIRALQALRKELNITRNEFLKLKGEITE